MKYEVIVIGAGAAGLMCAATAGLRGRKVLLIDHANKPGKKILMSGGGRCNFTNLDINPENYLCHNPHFVKSALGRYTQWDFLALVNQYTIPWHDKGQGQLFCDNKASDILNMLLAECDKGKVTLQTHCEIEAVEKVDNQFQLLTACGDFTSDSLVVATGGLSIPTMGASGFGYTLAKQFGHTVLDTCASLVPFTLSGSTQKIVASLSGISLTATVENTRTAFTDELLFTHRGISGPAVLQLSNYWNLAEPITINFLPYHNLLECIANWKTTNGKQLIKNTLTQVLPKRFVHAWLPEQLQSKTVADLSKQDCDKLHNSFQQWQLTPSGTEGYRTAEVTRGGVHTDEISSKTFESRKQSGLYFIGEVMDVTGWLGGYNFQWAWASGWCAGQVV